MFLCFLAKTEVSSTQHLGKDCWHTIEKHTQIGKKKIPCVQNHFQKQQVQSQIHLTRSFNMHKLMDKSLSTCLT